MKKLMTMIAAAAMAFGLYAVEGDIDSFSAAGTNSTVLLDGQWVWTNKVIETAADIPTENDEITFVDNKMKMRTLGKTLGRNFQQSGAPVSITNEAVYLDTYINFEEPSDEIMAVTNTDTKIALYVLDNSEIVEEQKASRDVIGTNLIAIAAYWNEGAWEKRAFVFDVNKDVIANKAEHRLTVKVYPNVLVNDTRMGFRFFLDGDEGETYALPVQYVFPIVDNKIDFTAEPIPAQNPDNKYLGCDYTEIAAAVRSRANPDHDLLISLVQSQAELAGLDFVGRGTLGSLLLTENKPGFIGDDASTMTVATPTGVDTVTVTGEGVDFTDGVITFPVGCESITVAATYSNGCSIVKWTYDGGDITPAPVTAPKDITPLKGKVLTISAVAPKAIVNGVGYETLAAAYAAANRSGYALILCDQAFVEDFGGSVFGETDVIIIDLNGKILTSSDNSAPTIYNQGTLTITNSAGTGVLAPAEGGEMAIVNVGVLTIQAGVMDGAIINGWNETPGKLYITGGTFDGPIQNTETEGYVLAITGGNFNKEFFGAQVPDIPGIVDGYVAVEGPEGYWLVQEQGAPDDIAQVVVTVSEGVEETNKFADVALALAAVQAAEQAGQFPIYVTALAEEGLTIADGDNTAKIAKDVTITIGLVDQTEFWIVDGNLEYSGTIDGKVDADEITMPDGTETIALGLNAIVTVKAGTALTATSFTVPNGYMVKKEVIEDTFVQFSADEIVATVAAYGAAAPTPFASALDALAEVQLLEQDEQHFPITVTACVDDLAVTNPETEETITLGKGATITITADGWTFTGNVEGEVTLAPGKTITVPDTATEFKVNAPAGYKVVTTPGEGVVTYRVEELPDVCKIGDQGYKTLADAFNALTDDVNETITLLDDVAQGKIQVVKSFTLNLNGKTFTGSEFSVGVSQSPVGIKDIVISNGTMKCGTGMTYLVRLYGNSLTLKDVELDATDMVSPVTQERDNYTGAILATSGSVYLQGTTTIKNVATGLRAVSFNNYAGATNYKLGTLDFANGEDANVTISGDVLIAGGTVVNADKATFSNTKFIVAAGGEYCTAATLANSGLEAIVGEYPTEPATGGNYKVNETALAYLEFADAAAAAEAAEKVQVCADVTCDAATFTAAAQLIVGTKKVEVTDLTLAGTKIELAKGGEFTNAAVTEADFVAPAEGQKLVNNEGTWTVKDIVYATLKVAAGDNFVSDIVVTNEAGVIVNDGDTFDIDEKVVVAYQTATFTSGYELDESKGTLVVTLDKAGEATIEVFSKETQSTPVIDPTKPSDPMDKDAADAVAAEINAHPEKYIKVPDAFGEIGQTALATYQGYFTAVVTGSGDNCRVVLELNTAGQTALQNSVNGDVVKIKPADVAAGTATDVEITTIPGFYYGVKAGSGLGNMAITDSAPATGAKLTLDLPSFSGSGFYTVVASPTPLQ